MTNSVGVAMFFRKMCLSVCVFIGRLLKCWPLIFPPFLSALKNRPLGFFVDTLKPPVYKAKHSGTSAKEKNGVSDEFRRGALVGSASSMSLEDELNVRPRIGVVQSL